jgi:hypothetical protein
MAKAEGGFSLVTRVKLELDPDTFGRLVETAVAEQRPADWQAEVILRRALGTWEEPRVGYPVPVATLTPHERIEASEAERVPA